MLSYRLRCKKKIESKNTKIIKTKNGRVMFLSKCTVCDGKKSRFIKEQEASRLLSSLRISQTPLVGPLLF